MKAKKTERVTFRLEKPLREVIQQRAAGRRLDEADIIREILWEKFGKAIDLRAA